MKKRLLSLLLSLAMCLSLCVPVFAAEDSPAVVTRIPVIDNTVFETPPVFNRGDSIPSKPINLNGEDYTISGVFDTSIYTEYHFYPDANGKFYYNVTLTWPNSYVTIKGIRVECWNYDTNRRVTNTSFEMELNDDNLYGPTVSSGTRVVHDLDSTCRYYLRFVKATDGIDATITGTIYT